MVRGALAIFLGLALFFLPDKKSRPMLANFMGFYWLVSGVVSLRWGPRYDRYGDCPSLLASSGYWQD